MLTNPKPPPVVSESLDKTSNERPQLIFDWRDWLPYLADETASEDEKRKMIETVWAIVMSFADLGWDVRDALKPDEKTCGQVVDLKAALAKAMLQSEDQPKIESEEV